MRSPSLPALSRTSRLGFIVGRIALLLVAWSPLASRSDTTHEYESPDRRFGVRLRMFETDVVRGILLAGNAGTGDGRASVANAELEAFARRHGFAMAATRGFWGADIFDRDGAVVAAAFEHFASATGRPELRHAPWIVYGNSSSGAFAYGLACRFPERTLCFTANVPAGLSPLPRIPDAALQVPGVVILGDQDTISSQAVAQAQQIFPWARQRRALWAWTLVEGLNHETSRSPQLFVPYWEWAIAARLPAGADPRQGPVALKPVKVTDGWLVKRGEAAAGGATFTPFKTLANFDVSYEWLPNAELAIALATLSAQGARATLDLAGGDRYSEVGQRFSRFRVGDWVRLEAGMSEIRFWQTIDVYAGGELVGQLHRPRQHAVQHPSFLVEVGAGERMTRSFAITAADSLDRRYLGEFATIWAEPRATAKSPSGIEVVTVLETEMDRATILWPRVEAAARFEVLRGADVIGWTHFSAFSVPLGTADAAAGEFSVRALAGDGRKLTEWPVPALRRRPPSLTRVAVAQATADAIELRWDAPVGAREARVEVLLGGEVIATTEESRIRLERSRLRLPAELTVRLRFANGAVSSPSDVVYVP